MKSIDTDSDIVWLLAFHILFNIKCDSDKGQFCWPTFHVHSCVIHWCSGYNADAVFVGRRRPSLVRRPFPLTSANSGDDDEHNDNHQRRTWQLFALSFVSSDICQIYFTMNEVAWQDYSETCDVFCNLAISVRVLCSVMVWWTASLCGFVFTMWCFCRRWYLLMQFCLCTCSFVLAFSLRFNGHFQAEPGLAGVYWSKGWWKWWWQIEL